MQISMVSIWTLILSCGLAAGMEQRAGTSYSTPQLPADQLMVRVSEGLRVNFSSVTQVREELSKDVDEIRHMLQETLPLESTSSTQASFATARLNPLVAVWPPRASPTTALLKMSLKSGAALKHDEQEKTIQKPSSTAKPSSSPGPKLSPSPKGKNNSDKTSSPSPKSYQSSEFKNNSTETSVGVGAGVVGTLFLICLCCVCCCSGRSGDILKNQLFPLDKKAPNSWDDELHEVWVIDASAFPDRFGHVPDRSEAAHEPDSDPD